MTIFKPIRNAGVALLIGAGIGGGLVHFYDRRQVRRNWLGSNCIQSHTLMHQIDLYDKRAGSDLGNNLQELLDVKIRILGLFASKVGGEGDLAKHQLKQIGEFRLKHPFQASVSEISESVKAAIALGK